MKTAHAVVLQAVIVVVIITIAITYIHRNIKSNTFQFDYDVSTVHDNKTCYSKLKDPENNRNKLKYTFCVYN